MDIYDEGFFCENSQQFLVIYFFRVEALSLLGQGMQEWTK